MNKLHKTEVKVLEKQEKVVGKRGGIKTKIAYCFVVCMLCCTFFTSQVYAAGFNPAEKGSSWLLDQIFWIAMVAVIIIILMAILKRNTIGGIITLITGCVVLYLIKTPTKLAEIGEILGGILF